MQIDLVGCTSAGKSTLAKNILHACREQGMDIVLGDDLVLSAVRLGWVKSSLLRKGLVNLAALCACLVTWRSNREIYAFAARHLLQLPIAPLEKFYTLRNVLKRVGIHEIVRRREAGQQVILIDEGVLQSAHSLFVHVSAQVKADQLSAFADLVPLPDVIVYLRQPETLLIDRTLKRGHKRIPDGSSDSVSRFIRQAIAMFDELARFPAIASRLLVVDGSQSVKMVAQHPDNPAIALAWQIIQSGLGNDTTEPGEQVPAPGLYPMSTSSDSR